MQNLEVAVKSLFNSLGNRISTGASGALLHHSHSQGSVRECPSMGTGMSSEGSRCLTKLFGEEERSSLFSAELDREDAGLQLLSDFWPSSRV